MAWPAARWMSGASATTGARVHVAFWLAVVGIAFVLILATLHLLQSLEGEAPLGTRWWSGYAGLWLLLLGVMLAWNRWLFFPVHLRRMLAGRGLEHFKVDKDWARARTRELWVLFDYDSPLFDYLPFARKGLRKGATQHDTGSSATEHYMHDRAAVHVFVPARSHDLPRGTLVLGRDAAPRWLDGGGDDPKLRRALDRAARNLGEPGLRVTLELSEDFLRAEVRGGSWLGQRFARRIEDTLRFVEALTGALGGRFRAGDAGQVVIERAQGRFVARPASGDTAPGARCAAAALATAALLTACSDGDPLAGAGEPDPTPTAPATGYPAEADPSQTAAASDAAPGGPERDPAARLTGDPAAALADPAMLRYRPPALAANHVNGEPPDAASSDADPGALRLDATTGRLFLPGKGWLEAEQARALYAERPQELPAGVDLERLHHLMAAMEARPR